MPFDSKRFDDLARELDRIVGAHTQDLLKTVQVGPTRIERLDWVNSAGAVQNQLWERIVNADLIFCDVTGQNPNVMFEAGVCAALKRVEQVIFLRDGFYRPEQPFDIAPIRYVKYQMTSEGHLQFENTIKDFIVEAAIRFPDRDLAGEPGIIDLPVRMNFSDNRDDERLRTPPASHRCVRAGHFEFGSLWSFRHSWATIGKICPPTFKLEFAAKFAKLHPNKDHGYIGVGFRSQHVLMPFCHVLFLNRDGSIKLAQPDEEEQLGFRNIDLRAVSPIDTDVDHLFGLTMTDRELYVAVDDFHQTFSLAELPKVLPHGLIRFQSHLAWMGLSRVSLSIP